MFKYHDVLPVAGGLLDQPIWFLVHTMAFDTVYEARHHMAQKEANMGELTIEQLHMIGWLDG